MADEGNDTRFAAEPTRPELRRPDLAATDRRRLERELEIALRTQEQLVSTLAGELRSPIATLTCGVDLLTYLGAQDPEVAQAASVLRRQTSQVQRLVQDLHDTAQLLRGRLYVEDRHLDLAGLVHDTARGHAALFGGAGLVFEVEGPRQAVHVRGDPVRLAQVLGNLLQNAWKFTPGPGEVHVRLEAKDGHAVVRVRDTGVGIDPKAVEVIFRPFVQLAAGGATRGIGLGLTLTRGIVELHGGRVEAHSDGPGKGTEVALRLPRAARGSGQAST